MLTAVLAFLGEPNASSFFTNVLQFSLFGLGTGALIAGIALGVVLTYRGSGIINLATGAVAMVGGYSFWALKSDPQYPHGRFGFTLGTAPALVVTLLVCALVGVLMEVLVFRPLRTAAPLAKLVASLGILLSLQSAMLLSFGTQAKTPHDILPRGNVGLLHGAHPVTIQQNRFWLAGIVLGIAVLLMVLYRWTRFGLATRAASENEVAGMLAGLSPNQLSLVNTALAAIVAGAMGVLAAPLLQVDSNSLPLQIVPALAAAVFARFTSFGIAAVVGILIGAAQSLLTYYVANQHWFLHDLHLNDQGNQLPGLAALLTFVVIVAGLFWRGASLPTRGELVEKRLPAVPRPERLLRPTVLFAAAAVLLLIVLPFGYRQALMNSLVGVVVCLSMVAIIGFVGQVSLAQVALAGVAGFVVSRLVTDHGVGFPWGPLAGSVAAAVLGLVVGVSALRVRGVSLAVVTIAGAVAIEQFVFDNSTWGAGASGSPVKQPHIGGLNLGFTASFRGVDGNIPSPILGFVFAGVVVLLCLLVANLRRSQLGQQMLAVRSNERAAAAAGINVAYVKFAAYALSSFIAGTAGWMYAYNFGSVTASRFGILIALSFVAFAYIGGITMVSGAVFGGLIATEGLFSHFIESGFSNNWSLSGNWLLLFGGLVLIFNLIAFPEGVAGNSYKKKQLRKKAGVQTLGERLFARYVRRQPLPASGLRR
jgi:branched-chain amino acid transport system permease protein